MILTFIVAIIVAIIFLLCVFILGYGIGMRNAVELSKVKSGEDPIFNSSRPQSWKLSHKDIDNIKDWEEFEKHNKDEE